MVVTGDEVVNGQAAPGAYLTARTLLGVEPAACVAIEDSPTGAASAEAAGCRVVVVPNHVEVPLTPAGRRRHLGSVNLDYLSVSAPGCAQETLLAER